MNTDKAYLLGLIIGGGIWGNSEDVFKIRLPFKQWGSYTTNPERAGKISQDVMRVVSPLFRSVYGILVSYDTSNSGIWNILCEGDLSQLKSELEGYEIICEGEVRKSANIERIVPELIDDNLKRRFLAGLADTIGSLKPSHRRFNNDKQMISFEVSGFEFNFVCSLCRLLHSIKCYPDQVAWNHPNFHCGSNPYDKRWKKGFKLRVFIDQYDKFGAFAFSSKAESIKQNKKLEAKPNEAIPCSERHIDINRTSISCVHCDENSLLLPPHIRGGHYLHNRHVCAVLNCEHAPYNEVENLINHAGELVNPFPVLIKGTNEQIRSIIESNELYKNRTYSKYDISISDLYRTSLNNNTHFLYGDETSGYPINKIILAITYLIAAKTNKLNGSKHSGSKDEIIKNYILKNPTATVAIYVPEIMTPIVLSMDKFSSIVGPNNPKVYQKLIRRDTNNIYKISVNPITEEDLQ